MAKYFFHLYYLLYNNYFSSFLLDMSMSRKVGFRHPDYGPLNLKVLLTFNLKSIAASFCIITWSTYGT